MDAGGLRVGRRAISAGLSAAAAPRSWLNRLHDRPFAGPVRRRPHASAAARPPADGRGVPLAVVRGAAVGVGPGDGARAVPLGDPAARGRARLRGGRALRRGRHARARPADLARDRMRALADDRPGGRHRLSAAGREPAAAADPRRRRRCRTAAAARGRGRRPDRRGPRLRRSGRALRRRRQRRARRGLRGPQEHCGLPQRSRHPALVRGGGRGGARAPARGRGHARPGAGARRLPAAARAARRPPRRPARAAARRLRRPRPRPAPRQPAAPARDARERGGRRACTS